MNVFIVESPKFDEVISNVNESASIKNLCEQFGHRAISVTEFSTNGLEYLSSSISNSWLDSANEMLCIHVSCHGNNDGVSFGDDFMTWGDFLLCFKDVLTHDNSAKLIFCISACGTKSQQFTGYCKRLHDELGLQPPKYWVLFDQEKISWRRSLVCWSNVYYALSNNDKYQALRMQRAVKASKCITNGNAALMYYLWDVDKSKYEPFRATGFKV